MQERIQGWFEELSQKLSVPVWVIAAVVLVLLIGAVALSISQIDQATALPPDDGEFQTTVSGLDILLKLGLVVVLIYLSLFVIGRLRGHRTADVRQRMEVLASTRLSPKTAIHIVRVGGKRIVVGATDHHLSYLGDYVPGSEDIGDFPSMLEQSMETGGHGEGELD